MRNNGGIQLSKKLITNIKKHVKYNGRNTRTTKFYSGMSLNSYWDAGSRNYYYFLQLNPHNPNSILSVREIRQNGTPFDGLDYKTTTLQENEILVEVRIDMGKKTGMTLFINE